jgi:CBS domain-containing protein
MISASDMLELSLAIYGVDSHAIDAMLDERHTIESLPVVDGEKFVGLVTSTDVIRYLLAQY